MKFKFPNIKIEVNKKILKRVGLSLGLGIAMLYVFLILSNLDIPVSSENQVMKWTYKVFSNDKSFNKPLPNDLLLVNIGYDRALEDICDEDGMPLGNIDITDRKKLIDFLAMAQTVGDYKYILMDVRFADDVKTDVDSALWKALSSTDRLILPSHHGMNIADKSLEHIIANSDYAITILENDFVKYPIIIDAKPSMVWYAYNSQFHDSIHHIAGLTFAEGHIMRMSIIPNIDILANDFYDNNGEKKVYNLGEDLLDDSDNMKDLLSGKFIVIGDFVNQDYHSTYRGIMHGPMIHVNVLYNMLKKEHLISWPILLVLLILFSSSFALVMFQPRIIRKLRNPIFIYIFKRVPKFGHFCSNLYQILLSFVGFWTLYVIVFLLIFKTTNQIYEILIFSSFFTIISSILNINNHIEQS